ncbi:MAG TPA: hypothetical protein VM677_03360 [Actinokineospora sp.]|nr:hypothetical protein [Actinokineospora sp.]
MSEEASSTTWSSGAGVVESVDGFISALTSDAQGEGVDVIDATLAGAGMVVDVVSSVGDPLGAILSAGIGWLLEHVSFLREPLDALLGNPDEINANVDQLKSAALEMKLVAREHREDVSTMDGWSGEASEAFRANMDQMAAEYEALGSTMDGTAAIYALSGALVCELRALVFETIADFISSLITPALIAAASAIVTCGASIATFAGWAGTRAAMIATKLADRLRKLGAAMTRMGGRLAKLGEKMDTLVKGLGRFAEYGDYAKTAYDAVQPYEMPPATA